MSKNGMLVALMGEYRKATADYKQILLKLSQANFERIVDEKTEDSDCKSIQTITFHIIQSGYTYSNYINSISKRKGVVYNEEVNTPKKGILEIDNMLNYTENSFNGIWNKTNDEIEKLKFKTRWNVTYDLEQLMEHAIVHVLRHRQQVEKFLKIIKIK